VKQHSADGVLTIVMDRPESLNSVDADELQRLADAVAAGSVDESIGVIVLAGDDRAFCSGADLGTAAELSQPAVAAATIDAGNLLVANILGSPKPVVTLARGVVAGIGVPIALAGDLVLCTDASFFLLAFTKVGLMPDGGATALVAASVGRARAMRMAMLAERMSSGEALAAGLVTHVFDTDHYDAEAAAIIRKLAVGPRAAFQRTKAAINAATLGSLPAAFATERDGQVGLLGAPDFLEGATAFQERRIPDFRDR
jgi:enoyl-CoA hydratase